VRLARPFRPTLKNIAVTFPSLPPQEVDGDAAKFRVKGVFMLKRVAAQSLIVAGIIICLLIVGMRRPQATLRAGNDPFAVALNAATGRIYVANFGEASVTVVDSATGKTFDIPVGTRPAALAVDSVRNKIYVANSADSTLTIIDGSNNQTRSIATGKGPVALAVNEETGIAYALTSSATQSPRSSPPAI
jgi:YVTN family beta-propeller protein